jgi:hypothetical protein
MDTMVRDLGILAALIVLGLLWNVYSVVTRRGKREQARQREKERQAQEAERAVETKPLAGIDEYVTAHGWQGPTTDLALDGPTQDYVQETIRHLAGVGSARGSAGETVAPAPTRYANVFTGADDGRSWTLANAWTPIGAVSSGLPGHRMLRSSVCLLALGEVLPPLFIGPRDRPPYTRLLLLKEITLESEDFDRRFRVQALDRKFASDVMSPRAMELVMRRNDWTFFLEMSRVICVCAEPFRTAADAHDRLEVVKQFAALIPSFVSTDRSLQLPTLPDGTTLDPTDPASRERFEAALSAMTPAQREAFATQAQAGGLRFLAGMFGKDLPPGAAEDAVQRVDEKHRHS